MSLNTSPRTAGLFPSQFSHKPQNHLNNTLQNYAVNNTASLVSQGMNDTVVFNNTM